MSVSYADVMSLISTHTKINYTVKLKMRLIRKNVKSRTKLKQKNNWKTKTRTKK